MKYYILQYKENGKTINSSLIKSNYDFFGFMFFVENNLKLNITGYFKITLK